MSDIYEELKRLFGDREEEGMSTLDMMGLPSSVRTVVQLMLRNRGEMTYTALRESVGQLAENKRLTQAELDEILDAMSRLNLLQRSEQKRDILYKVNLGPTSGGTRSQSRSPAEPGSASEGVDTVWDALSSEGDSDEGRGFFRRILDALGLTSRS